MKKFFKKLWQSLGKNSQSTVPSDRWIKAVIYISVVVTFLIITAGLVTVASAIPWQTVGIILAIIFAVWIVAVATRSTNPRVRQYRGPAFRWLLGIGAILLVIFVGLPWIVSKWPESPPPSSGTARPAVNTQYVMATKTGSPDVHLRGAWLIAPHRDETYKVEFRAPSGRDTIVTRPKGEILNLPGDVSKVRLYSVVSEYLPFDVKSYPN